MSSTLTPPLGRNVDRIESNKNFQIPATMGALFKVMTYPRNVEPAFSNITVTKI